MDKRCGFLLQSDADLGAGGAGSPDIRKLLNSPDTPSKIEGMKALIHAHLRGEPQPSMLMTVIQQVVPSQDHALKKLVLLYWELVDKRGSDGKLLPEMILVCNFIRNDLHHANEYARGVTLRFLSKMMEADILEPLIPSVVANLDHALPYVRKNAILVLFNVYRHFEQLVPDAPALVEKFLEEEAGRGGSVACIRNAFLMLTHCAPASAVKYMLAHLDAGLDETLQLLMLDLIRREARRDPAHRSSFVRPLIVLLDSPSAAVQYDGATTLLTLSASGGAVRRAAATYIGLLADHADNNVRLIAMGRLATLCERHAELVGDMAAEVLRALASPSVEIRCKALELAEKLVTQRNVEQVMVLLRREVTQLSAAPPSDDPRQGDYRQTLVGTIHRCCLRFPDVAGSVVHSLLDLLGDRHTATAVDVAACVREIAESLPPLRAAIVKKILQSVPVIRSSRVFRAALWIVAEYVDAGSEQEILYAMSTFRHAVGGSLISGAVKGEIGLDDSTASENAAEAAAAAAVTAAGPKKGPRVLADGSYATEPSGGGGGSGGGDVGDSGARASEPVSTLRQLLLAGDFFLGCALCASLTKLCLKLARVAGESLSNRRSAETMRFMCELLRFGASGTPQQRMEADSRERVCACLRVLSDSASRFGEVLAAGGREAFAAMLAEEKARIGGGGGAAAGASDGAAGANGGSATPANAIQADELIAVRQLRPRSNPAEAIYDDDDAALSMATTGDGAAGGDGEDLSSRLSRVSALTGYSDPVYAEACVTVHADTCDIVLDIVLINQTAETLQNLSLELATVGELRLCERPGVMAIAPGASRRVTVNLKVSSTESGVVYGSIVYDTPGTGVRKVINLSDVHVDIMSLIHAHEVSDARFRAMWSEFEWENKVAINTAIGDVREYTRHIIRETNMCCLNEAATFSGSTEFLSANLVARSIFGEDALINVSVEREPDGKLVGTCRIRAKLQGLALSLGDRITLKQKGRDVSEKQQQLEREKEKEKERQGIAAA